MVVIWWLYGGYMVVIWWLYGGYMVVIWWLYGGYTMVISSESISDEFICVKLIVVLNH